MSTIKIILFDKPELYFDGIKINFPYKKAEALFYYVCIEQPVSRETAASVLWDGVDSSIAKKNLRHALYIIKQLFSVEVILSEQKHLIFNPEIEFDIDYHKFMKGNNLELYTNTLLSGFNIKDSYSYEQWLIEKQESTKKIYLSRLSNILNHASEYNIADIENYAAIFMQEDPYEESTYRILMEKYKENGSYHKGTCVYQKLSKLLEEDLGISPSKEITALYYELLNLWNENSAQVEPEITQPSYIKVHNAESKRLHYTFYDFLSGKDTQNLLIYGENGVGKTHLVNEFLSEIASEDVLILQTVCYQIEKQYLLHTWSSIIYLIDSYMNKKNITIPDHIYQILLQAFPAFEPSDAAVSHMFTDLTGQYNFNSCKDAVIKLMNLVSTYTKIVLVIDDLQYMDSVSLNLLFSILKLRNTNILAILICPNNLESELLPFTSPLTASGLLTQIPVQKLNKTETEEFIEESLLKTDTALDISMINKIYEETDGNLFFLVELLNNIQAKRDIKELSLTAQGILNNRLHSLSNEALQILDILSIVHNYITITTLSAIQNKQPLDLLEAIEELKAASLIIEKNDNSTAYFEFINHKMREFVYNKLSPSKLKILHNRVGEALEDYMVQTGTYSYKRLIYHFKLGSNIKKALHYEVKNIEKLSSANFDLYPISTSEVVDGELMSEKISEKFADLESQLYAARHALGKDYFTELSIRFHHAKGHYFILTGDYEKGVPCIQRALENPSTSNYPSLHLKLMRQMIYYGIQICDSEIMKTYLQKGLALSEETKNTVETALYLRLYSVYYMFRCQFDNAMDSLSQSIKCFESINLGDISYGLNIAASYNYMGEICLRQGNLQEALKFSNKAIEKCVEYNCIQSPVFFTSLGKINYFTGNLKECKKNLLIAENTYDNSTTLVSKAICKGFLALLDCNDNDFDSAKGHMESALYHANILKSSYDLAYIDFIRYKMLSDFPETSKFLDKTAKYYRNACRKVMEGFNDYSVLSVL
jgi:DNA-binding SARP family transcriptional activator